MTTAPPPVALTATPAHIALAGVAAEVVRVANPGKTVLVVEARVAGFALDLRGRPRIVVRRDRSIMLSVAPRRLALPPGGNGTVTVASTIGRNAAVGDHVGLVLLTTQPHGGSGVGVRMQIGVPVTVRVPGAIRRHVVLEGARVGAHLLELRFRNAGNVTATIGARRLRVELRRSGHLLGTLRARGRELLPGTRGIIDLRLPRRVRGRVRAVVEADDGAGGMLRRAFSLKRLLPNSRRPRDR